MSAIQRLSRCWMGGFSVMRPVNVSIRWYFGKPVNVYEAQNDHPFLERFLSEEHNTSDPVKEKYPIIRNFAKECKANPMMSGNKFEFVKLRYGMFLYVHCIDICFRINKLFILND